MMYECEEKGATTTQYLCINTVIYNLAYTECVRESHSSASYRFEMIIVHFIVPVVDVVVLFSAVFCDLFACGM